MSGKSTSFSENRILNCRGKLLDLHEPKVMGILNLTADSFYDGGTNQDQMSLLAKAEELVEGGAAILDIGAVSTKPGSILIDSNVEWKILDRPLKTLIKKFPKIIFSVDTYNSATAQKAADLGVEIINDISGGTIDSKMFDVVAKNNLTYVLMHIHGIPENMQQDPIQSDVISIVESFFSNQLIKLKEKGCNNILIDPGFGFGKTLDQNYQLLKGLSNFEHFNHALLIGLSRKSMIFKHLEISPNEALNGTSVLNTFALLNGANVLRVHDASEANDVIRLYIKYQQA